MSLEKFFENRYIHIPDLDPEKWAEECRRTGPPAASFCRNVYSREWWYESSTGNTRVVVHEDNDWGIVLDVSGDESHQKELMDECRKALTDGGYEVYEPRITSPMQPGTVGYLPVGSFSQLWDGAVPVAVLPKKSA